MRRIAAVMGLLTLTAGCGIIIHGTSEDIGFQSTPTGATVSVDSKPLGKTPVITKLSRKDDHVVHFELPGYQAADATITRGVSGWVWGNIVFGGLVGLAVDAISGGLYKLSPQQVSGTLTTQTSSMVTKDGLYVIVVMHPEPGWQRIGGLSRK